MDIVGLADFGRIVSTEGAVLLKNEGSVLPIKDERVSVFGRTQINYFKSGTGSGGAVNVRSVVNILDGLRQNPHILLNEELAQEYERLVIENPANYSNSFEADFSDREIELNESTVCHAREFSEKAIIVLGRVSGESYDNVNAEGSFLLTPKERSLIKTVRAYFDKVAVIINSGNIMDLRWIEEYGISSAMLCWQGGQYGGKAVADLVSGDVTPSGKLSDTIAYTYEDYPTTDNFGDAKRVIYTEDIYVGYRYFETFARDRVLYPFGFGLSYTEFELVTDNTRVENEKVSLRVTVKNTGEYSGKEVVQVYFNAPQGKLGKASRALVAFAKTKTLSPGEEQRLEISFKINDMASYDDSGVTGNPFCYVLEAGSYDIYVGANVRDALKVYTYHEPNTTVTEALEQILAPIIPFDRLKATECDGVLQKSYEAVPLRKESLEEKIENELPKAYEITGDQGIKLYDVYNGKADLADFVAQLTKEELAALVRGEGMLNPRVTPGTASCFGGVTDRLIDYKIVPCCTSDGPSGIRMDCNEPATNLPCGTLQACTWNPELVEALYKMQSIELEINNIDALLGPGMNIHRNPLCGRNFEYLSEDPLLTGIIAAAVVRGVQADKCSATIKHFACNNQEYSRKRVEAVVSERALREIYLKGFEIAVKSANPRAVMTTYNPTNGKWNASNYDLTTTALRKEWGFDGIVMTDWWADMNNTTGDDAPAQKNRAAMVRAQNDVYMCVPNHKASDNSIDDILDALENGDLSIGELQRCAENICRFVMKTKAFLSTEAPHSERYPNIPRLSSVAVGAKPLDGFNPLVLDYFVESLEDITAKPAGDAECEIFKTETCAKITVSHNNENVIYKLIKAENRKGSEESNSSNIGDCFINNNFTLACDVCAKPSDTVSCKLFVKQSADYILRFCTASDSNELAQLSAFIEAGDNRLAVSLRGTNGEWTEITVGTIKLYEGESELKISFGASNFGDVKISRIHFIRENQ